MSCSKHWNASEASRNLDESGKVENQYSKIEFYEAKGNLLLQQKKFDAALESYQLALEISPSAKIYLRLAHIFKQQKKEKDSLEARYQACLLDSSLAKAEDIHRIRETLKHYYQQALQQQPEEGGLHAKLAGIYAHQGESEEAIAHYQKAISFEPELASAQAGLASLYVQCQQWETAISHYEEALALDPNNRGIAIELGQSHLEAGRCFKSQGETEKAGWAYLKALELDPCLFSAYSGLRYDVIGHRTISKSSQHQRLLTETIKICERIIEQYPNLVIAHTTLGYALTRAGNVSAATDCYRRISRQVARQQGCDAEIKEQAECREPDFIIIGTQKGGTTSLHQYLRRHPQILSPVEKEINFFSWEYERGLDWYLSHFPPTPRDAGWLTGEVSPHYLYSPFAPQRIMDVFPDIQLGVILRNPIDRAISHYHMMVRKGDETRRFPDIVAQEIESLERANQKEVIPWRALNHSPYLGSGLYYHHLERWLKVFDREKILVIPSEKLLSDPDKTLESLYLNLGLEHHSESDYPKHHVGDYSPISHDLRELLADFFTHHNHKLEHQLSCLFDWS